MWTRETVLFTNTNVNTNKNLWNQVTSQLQFRTLLRRKDITVNMYNTWRRKLSCFPIRNNNRLLLCLSKISWCRNDFMQNLWTTFMYVQIYVITCVCLVSSVDITLLIPLVERSNNPEWLFLLSIILSVFLKRSIVGKCVLSTFPRPCLLNKILPPWKSIQMRLGRYLARVIPGLLEGTSYHTMP